MSEKEIICIQCPLSCKIIVKFEEIKEKDLKILSIQANKCIRGKEYAEKEIINPERTITTTVKTIFEFFPRLPVKTDKDVPLKDIFHFMEEINKIVVKEKIKIGDVVAYNLLEKGINLIATSSIDINEN
jgi:CxxC motif-containing protein